MIAQLVLICFLMTTRLAASAVEATVVMGSM